MVIVNVFTTKTRMSFQTHIFKPVLAELPQEVQEADEREPGAPEHHLVHILNVDDAEHEDELVEYVVPELVFDALRLRHPELPEHHPLDQESEQGERAVRDVYQGLEPKYWI